MNKIFQFKIDLDDTEPTIWRRIQIEGGCTFWDLHVAIQNAMGWTDSNLHKFIVIEPVTESELNIGIQFERDNAYNEKVIAGWKVKVVDYLHSNRKFIYIYDFDSNWEHTITLEKILDQKVSTNYPVCIGGARTCPPEDIGGVFGYEEFLSIIKDEDHLEYESMLMWCGGNFDPRYFDPNEVEFEDPRKRLEEMLK